MKTSQKGIDLVKHFEGIHDGNLTKIGLQPKMCPAGIWTAGYGHALRDLDGKWLKGVEGFSRLLEIYPEYETITEEEAEFLLAEDLTEFEGKIDSLHLPLEQHQFDALVSFSFNVGFKGFRNSTLYRRIKYHQGQEEQAFMMWVRCQGDILPGLVRRRKSEAHLYLTGELEFYE